MCGSLARRAWRRERGRGAPVAQRDDHLGAVQRAHADALELALAPLVQARDGVASQHDAEVALAGLVYRRPRAVGEVAATEHQRADPLPAQVTLEGGLIEGAPAGLVDRHLPRAQLLHSARQQQLAVE